MLKLCTLPLLPFQAWRLTLTSTYNQRAEPTPDFSVLQIKQFCSNGRMGEKGSKGWNGGKFRFKTGLWLKDQWYRQLTDSPSALTFDSACLTDHPSLPFLSQTTVSSSPHSRASLILKCLLADTHRGKKEVGLDQNIRGLLLLLGRSTSCES